MTEHFAAFSFVDRITDLTAGRSAKGVFAIPERIAPFSSCLVAEAVGQLAAWVAMSHIGFRGRPVAALASETLLAGDVAPGRTLNLAIEIADVDDDAVAYSGWANVDGTRVISLNDCLGPMLPLNDFDSADAMRERFDLLCSAGAAPARFRGVPSLPLEDMDVAPGRSATATLRVPLSAPFFADHFPRRPVFPATLLLDAQIRLALALAAASGNAAPKPARMTHVKMRSFIAPGDLLQLGAEMARDEHSGDRIMLSARSGERTIATARLQLQTHSS
jgi:3-hydroxymyristoyl/3-hydroxydecanoyl-(acyl carrier protein) dehydratase